LAQAHSFVAPLAKAVEAVVAAAVVVVKMLAPVVEVVEEAEEVEEGAVCAVDSAPSGEMAENVVAGGKSYRSESCGAAVFSSSQQTPQTMLMLKRLKRWKKCDVEMRHPTRR
jgi:hypothetical protein